MEELCDGVLECHTRAFSLIQGLQEEHCVQYLLCRGSEGLQIVIRQTGSRPCSATYPLTGSMERVRRVLQFLYENAVGVESAGDVLEDL